MDSERFDAIERSFAGGSRRRLLALLAGGLLGPLAGAASAAEPVGCRGFGAFCNRPDQCCSRNCHRGHCRRCAPPERNCGGVCRNLKEDEQNCGECGNRCPAGATCTTGQCVIPAAACPANSDFCADRSTRCSPVNRPACGCHRTTAGRVACLRARLKRERSPRMGG